MAGMVDRLIEMHARSNRKLTAVIERLTKRNHQLEQLIDQAIVLIDTHMPAGTPNADAWLKRAFEVLGEENRKESE